jgi:hypothetical protein
MDDQQKMPHNRGTQLVCNQQSNHVRNKISGSGDRKEKIESHTTFYLESKHQDAPPEKSAICKKYHIIALTLRLFAVESREFFTYLRI